MDKIIIVDDESLIRYSLASVFRGPLAEVFSAGTGTEAFDTVRKHRLDLCLLDVHLPDMNGLDIMRTLRDISPWTRIIIMTGSEITEAEMSSIRENAHCLISKPFDLEQVRSAADWLLRVRVEVGYAEKITAASCILWIADQMRKHQRRPVAREIVCTAVAPFGTNEPIPVSATVVDICESGMCIVTPMELQPGHIVRSDDRSMNGGGVVRWSRSSDPAGSYCAGIQFVAPKHLEYLMGTSAAY
jgi:CheY-like chemotaxis protein